MNDNCIANRTKLIDTPIVEMILSNVYRKSKIKFTLPDKKLELDGVNLICLVNGKKTNICIKRNSKKYFDSPNFTFSLNRNRLNVFNNTMFVFIDELNDSIYTVSGTKLLSYIISNSDNLHPSTTNKNVTWLIIPKQDIINMVDGCCSNGIIKCNKNIMNLFSLNRDENLFRYLT